MTASKRKKLAPVVSIPSLLAVRAADKRLADLQWKDAALAELRAEEAARPLAVVLPFKPRAS